MGEEREDGEEGRSWGKLAEIKRSQTRSSGVISLSFLSKLDNSKTVVDQKKKKRRRKRKKRFGGGGHGAVVVVRWVLICCKLFG